MVSLSTTVAREDVLNKEPLVLSTTTNKGSHYDVTRILDISNLLVLTSQGRSATGRLLVLTSQGRSATGRNEGTPLIVIAQSSFNRC